MLLNILIKYSFSLKRDTCCLQTERNRTQAVYNRETNDLQMADTVIEGWLMLTDTKGREKEFVTNFVVHSSTGLACKSIYFHLISKNSILGYRNQNFRNRNVSLEIFDLRSWKNILKRAVSIAKIILENTFTNIMSKNDSSEE